MKVQDTFKTRPLTHLSSQMKQALLDRIKDNIRVLAQLKAKGHKVGVLRFKSRIRSLPLKQYGNTYRILDKKYVQIQGSSRESGSTDSTRYPRAPKSPAECYWSATATTISPSSPTSKERRKNHRLTPWASILELPPSSPFPRVSLFSMGCRST